MAAAPEVFARRFFEILLQPSTGISALVAVG
jgi:hypothetical protein